MSLSTLIESFKTQGEQNWNLASFLFSEFVILSITLLFSFRGIVFLNKHSPILKVIMGQGPTNLLKTKVVTTFATSCDMHRLRPHQSFISVIQLWDGPRTLLKRAIYLQSLSEKEPIALADNGHLVFSSPKGHNNILVCFWPYIMIICVLKRILLPKRQLSYNY